MKRILTLTVIFLAVIGLSQIAFAGPEHLEAKSMAQPVLEQTCNWTGWYIGGHFGYSGGNTSWAAADDLTELQNQQDFGDIFGGLQIGYNRQIGDWFLVGMELTGSYSGVDESRSFVRDSGEEVDTYNTRQDWSGTAALRAGFLSMNNKMLFYGKFGAAITSWNYSFLHDETNENGRQIPEFDRWNESEIRVNPMIGLGIEYSFACHWSAKIEYQHIFFKDEGQDLLGTLFEDSTAFSESNEPGFGYRIKDSLDSVQMGINYHF